MKITVEVFVKADPSTTWQAWNNPTGHPAVERRLGRLATTRSTVDLREGGTCTSRMEAKDGSEGFDLEGTYTRIVPRKVIESRLADGRTVKVAFAEVADGVRVTETFEAETENSPELQRAGWQAILDNFAGYVEAKHKAATTG